jgi:hypothetical protein
MAIAKRATTISGGPCTKVNLAEGEVTWLAAPEGTGAQRALVAAGGGGAGGTGGPKAKKPPKLVQAGAAGLGVTLGGPPETVEQVEARLGKVGPRRLRAPSVKRLKP